MTDEEKKKLLIIRIGTLRIELAERVGFDAYEVFDFDAMSYSDLEMVRKAIHESLYAPPPRTSS